MQATDWSFIAIELGLVFGGALAFGWWQLRDLERERRATALRRQQAQQQTPAAAPAAAADPSQPAPPSG